MEAKLIKDTGKQRYYQIPFKIEKCFFSSILGRGKPFTITELWAADPIKLIEPYELAEDISKSIDKICVSDAKTHVERLVFPAFNIRDKLTGETRLIHRCNNIDGRHAMMIHGGDYKSVYSDITYIRHLWLLNRGCNKEHKRQS